MTSGDGAVEIERPRGGATAWAWAWFGLILLGYWLVIFSARRPPPFLDYPNWVYQGVLLRGVLQGSPVEGYALKHYPVPNSLTTVALGLLDLVLPWPVAAKVWVCACLGLAPCAVWSLSRAVGGVSAAAVVASPALLFLNLDLWQGHISYEIGLCLVLLVGAALLRGAGAMQLTGLLTLLFFTHMEACACALLLVVLWCRQTGRWERLRTAAPAVLLTGWYAVGRFSSGNPDGTSVNAVSRPFGSRSFLLYKLGSVAKVFGFVNAVSATGLSQSERIFGRPGYVLLLAISACLALLLLSLFLGKRESVAGARLRFVRQFTAVLVAVGLVLPQMVFGVADPGSRLVLAGVGAGLFAVRWPRRRGFAIAACGVVFAVANLWQLARLQQDPLMEGRARDLPAPLLQYGRVQPWMGLPMYDALESGATSAPIYETGLFRSTRR